MIVSLERVTEINPQYRDASALLAMARKNSEAARQYDEGIRLQSQGDLKGALDRFRKAQGINPGYRDLRELMPKLNAQLDRINKEAQVLYVQAMNQMQAKNWDSAVTTLEKIQSLSPGYSDVQAKLTEANANRLADAKISNVTRHRLEMLYLSGGLLALITLPLVGLLIFSPVSRAKALALSRNYAAAVEIYEAVLKSAPGRMGLYKELADLYVLLNRRDKRALQVYKTVLQFDLKAKKRHEIELIVSQNYMGEEDIDIDRLQGLHLGTPRVKTMSWTEHLEACLTAVEQFDNAGLDNALARAAMDLSHPVLLTQVIMPMMQTIGQQWAEGTMRVKHEHMASATVRNFLGALIESYTPPPDAPAIIVTTPKGQLHELGALAAGIVAASEGWRVLYLGPNLPADEIAASVKKMRAKAVALSMIWPDGNPDVDAEIQKLRKHLGVSVALIVGGRAAESHSATLNEVGAIRIHSVHELISFREILENVRLKY